MEQEEEAAAAVAIWWSSKELEPGRRAQWISVSDIPETSFLRHHRDSLSRTLCPAPFLRSRFTRPPPVSPSSSMVRTRVVSSHWNKASTYWVNQILVDELLRVLFLSVFVFVCVFFVFFCLNLYFRLANQFLTSKRV